MKKLIARMLVVAFAVSFASIAYATTNTTISCLTTNTEPVHTIKREFNYMDAGMKERIYLLNFSIMHNLLSMVYR